MVSSQGYLQFILEQLHELEEITYRAMMGKYIIYYRGTGDEMSKHIDKKKVIKKIILSFLISIIVLAYPIYAVIIWNTSGSPDDISKFPSSSVWICETENFIMTIDLQVLEE